MPLNHHKHTTALCLITARLPMALPSPWGAPIQLERLWAGRVAGDGHGKGASEVGTPQPQTCKEGV